MNSSTSTKKRFLLLHVGFTPPTPQIMAAWGEWFASITGIQADAAGFMGGVEVTKDAERRLAWDSDSLTGYNVIEADSLEAAVAIARKAPMIGAVRVYELRGSH